MKKFAIMLLCCAIFLSQDLPALQFGVLVSKCNKFNRINKSPKNIVVNNDNSDRAKEIAKVLSAEVTTIEDLLTTGEYVALVFIGVSNEDIFKAKKKIPNSISYTDSKDNISVCSVHLGLKEDKKPLILVNLAVAKAEAELSSTFLKITQLYQQ